MKRTFALMTAGLVLAASDAAFGQFAVVDQTRTVSSAATGSFGTNDTKTDTDTASGTYNQSYSSTKTDTGVDTAGGNAYVYNCAANASQNSLIDTSGFSGSGTAGGVATVIPLDFPASTAAGIGHSLLDVDFTVAAPTLITITGEIKMTSEYTLGYLPILSTDVTLSDMTNPSTAGPSQTLQIAVNGGTQTYDDPFSFSVELVPGDVYRLDAEANVDVEKRGGVGISIATPSSASFTFAAAVPEPTSMMLVLPALWIMRRPKRQL